MSGKLHINHYAEAERCASDAARRTGPDGPYVDPQTSTLLLAQAQVHATLAALPNQVVIANENIKEYRAERDALRSVIVGHVYEALMSPACETRKFAAGITYELDRVGANIDGEIDELSESRGHGPYHYTVDGVVYRLLVQVVDDEGIVWEHSGDWTAKGEPVMTTDLVFVPPKPGVPLPELVRTRGPLKPRKPDPSIAPF